MSFYGLLAGAQSGDRTGLRGSEGGWLGSTCSTRCPLVVCADTEGFARFLAGLGRRALKAEVVLQGFRV